MSYLLPMFRGVSQSDHSTRDQMSGTQRSSLQKNNTATSADWSYSHTSPKSGFCLGFDSHRLVSKQDLETAGRLASCDFPLLATYLHIVANSSALLWTLFLHFSEIPLGSTFTAGLNVPGRRSILLATSSLSLTSNTPASSKTSRMAQILKATSPVMGEVLGMSE